MDLSEYIPSEDYKQLHLQFIRENPRFKPYTPVLEMYKGDYYKEMTALYYGTDAVYKLNKTAYTLVRDDYERCFGPIAKPATKKLQLMFGKPEDTQISYFVTFNFDTKLFKTPDILNIGVSRFLKLSWLVSCYGVFEYHGQNNHPHLMMRVTVDKNIIKNKGKLKDKLIQTSLYTKFVSGVNFLDIKPFSPYHNDYLLLSKTESKTESMEKDILWRIEYNLPEYIEK